MSEDTEYTTISVRVTKEKRRKWEDYLPESDAENVSQLVRMGVKHEIDGRADTPQTPENAIEPEVMGEVTEGIDTLQKAVKDVQTRLSTIEEETEVADGMDIQDAVFRTLPTPPTEAEDTEHSAYAEWASTSDDIAMNIARSKDAVIEVLEQLEGLGQVRSVTGGPDNETYYWKRQ
jgi:predicted nuclease with TOPRIM domain